ncbi:MAG: hypothetical protein M0D57_01310 [Sphingobacteriales bacterium JAD_PAG50586_3]|nr:MAG: hypothetical protein M0D57_01310 [Sphingobacteriales bacterium JAD_PAG50586_3]
MRTLVLVVSAVVALSSCMQQNTAENTGQTTQGTKVQPQSNADTPATANTVDTKTVVAEPLAKVNNTGFSVNKLKELNALIQSYSPKRKLYTIPSNRVSKIKGDRGSILELDPKNLENLDGSPVTGTIVVEFAEYTSAKDLVFAGASTISDGKPLVSAGSYYISTTNNGKPMRVKNGKELKLSVVQLKDKEMDIFYGEKTSTGTVNWKWDADIFKGENAEGIKQPVTVGSEAMADVAPKVTDAQYNCFNIELDGNNYAVITVGNTVKIKKAENNTQVQYIRNSTFPPTTLCVRGFSNKVFRTYKADTTRKGGFVEYTIIDNKTTDAVDIDYLKALKSTNIKVPVTSIVTRVVPEKYLADTLLTIKAAKMKKQEEEAKRLNKKDITTGNWSGFDLGGITPQTKTIKIDSVKSLASQDLYTQLHIKKLGWVNCDKFPRMTSQPMIARYNPAEFNLVSGVLVFRKQLVVLYANHFEEGKVGFQSVPANQECLLITFSSLNNKLYAQVQNIQTDGKAIPLDLKPMDNKEFKGLLEASIK